jgi:hypothetical protein
MTLYDLGEWQEKRTIIKSKPVFFVVRFQLSESEIEHLPVSTSRAIEGDLCKRFYCQPMQGDIIKHGGYLWRVCGLFHEPPNKHSKQEDRVPLVLTEWISQAPEDAPP